MTLSVEQGYSPRGVKVRRRKSFLVLRQPEAAYAPAALVLLFATGLMAMLVSLTILSGPGGATAAMLATPALAATVTTALTIGVRLRRLKERKQPSMIMRIAFIWAFFGCAWSLLQIIPAITHGDIHSFGQLLETLWAMAFDAIAGASAGAIGGAAGGAAAIAVCVERVR